MATTIITKYGSGAPAASDVVRGELAVDTENKRLYTEDSGGSVVELGTNPTTLAVDTDTLVVDAANDRVGIGTNSPSSPLHVNVGTNLNFEVENSSSTLRLSALNDARDANIAMQFASSSFQFITGNVGIGTTSPSFGLSVESDNGSGYAALFRKSSSDPALTIQTTSSITQIQGLNSALSATNNIAMQVSGGNVGIGTASPVSPLTTSIGAGSAGSLNNQIAMTHTGASNSYHIKTIRASANDEPAGLAFVENTTERMRIDSSGNVGIGTSNPNALTHIYGGSSGRTWTPDNADKLALEHSSSVAFDIRTPASEQGLIMFSDADARARGILAYAHSSDFMYFNTAGAERMRIDSSGRLGLSTTPNTNWRNDIADTGVLQFGTEATMFSDAGVTTEIWNNAYVNNSDAFFNISTRGASRYRLYAGKHEWWTAASASAGTNITSEIQTTPKMTLDVSGNLLVGKTANDNTTNGFVLDGNGTLNIVRSSEYLMRLNRTSTAGEIARFQKDGTTVGSIGTTSSTMWIAGNSTEDTGIRFYTVGIAPCDSSGTYRDNSRDLGSSTVRWDDVYATNGTIQTSDRNEKQDIEELSDAEQRVAVAAKGLLRKFRWKSSVAENGDDARIHFGIIAQDLQAAFEAEGLDAGRYAMFINTTWTDEETGEERSRMGVRYSELLAFIIAAI